MDHKIKNIMPQQGYNVVHFIDNWDCNTISGTKNSIDWCNGVELVLYLCGYIIVKATEVDLLYNYIYSHAEFYHTGIYRLTNKKNQQTVKHGNTHITTTSTDKP